MSLAGHALTIGYSDRVVGRGLDVTLAQGEVLALLGPNGGGKTTLLKTLLGLLKPLAGEAVIDGKSLAVGGFRSESRDVTNYGTLGLVTVWNWKERKRSNTFEDVNGSVNAVAFSPDGSTLAWAGWGTANLWNFAERKRVLIDLNGVTVNSLAFSPAPTISFG